MSEVGIELGLGLLFLIVGYKVKVIPDLAAGVTLGIGVMLLLIGLVGILRKRPTFGSIGQDNTARLQNEIAKLTKENDSLKKKNTRFNGITPAQTALWLILSEQVEKNHGHDDKAGIAADLAGNVPEGEIMSRNCGECGKARNLKIKGRRKV